MSENLNPTRCGNCGTLNPPDQEYCVNCHAPLTRAAAGDALAGTPDAPDALEQREGPPVDEPAAEPDPTGGGPLPTEGMPPDAGTAREA